MSAKELLQLRLDTSQGILAIAEPVPKIYVTSPIGESQIIPRPQIIPPPQAYISKLPYELLVAVIEATHTSQYYAWTITPALSLVSRAFHGIANEFLYRRVKLQLMQMTKSTERLYRSLMANHSLGRHIRRMDVQFETGWDVQEAERMVGKAIEILTEFMDLAPLTQRVTINSFFVNRIDAQVPTIINLAPTKLPNLQRYYLYGGLGSYIHSIDCFEALTRAKRLEKLHISPDMHYPGQRSALPARLERAAPFTTLDIHTCWDGFDAVVHLIHWPQTLKHVKIDAQAGYGFKTNLDQLFNAFALHGSSLETIDIGYLDDKIEQRINLRHFIALRKLTMSRWSFRDEQLEFCRSFARGILAPELREFIWEFNIHEQSQPGPMDLDERCISWIHKFGQFAAERHMKLKRILIRFRPEVYGDWGSYPWDSLWPVKEDLASCGIELHFDSPVANKEAYETVAQGLRDDAARWEREFREETAKQEQQLRDEAIRDTRDIADRILDYATWLERNPEKAVAVEEEPDFSDDRFYLIEGKDIRQYFDSHPAPTDDH